MSREPVRLRTLVAEETLVPMLVIYFGHEFFSDAGVSVEVISVFNEATLAALPEHAINIAKPLGHKDLIFCLLNYRVLF